MPSFQVLDREQNVHSHFLIEASAGTGKTFSIENIVVRLLVEEEPLSLEQILVVTFTRAATRDLKSRIRSNIEKSIAFLQSSEGEKNPDYLLKIVELGEAAVANATKKLERALLYFDQAQIFTIHSFCARILNEYVFEGNLRVDAISIDDPLSQNRILTIVRDFFRTGISPDRYGEEEIKQVLKAHKGELERLEKALLETITKGLDIEAYPPFSCLVDVFAEKMQRIKELYHLESEKILYDFSLQAPSYNGLCDRQRKIKSDVIERIDRFAKLFDSEHYGEEEYSQFIEDKLFILSALDSDNLSARIPPPPPEKLHYPDFTTYLRQELASFISPAGVFARMAHDCQKLLRQHLEQEEKFGFDDILKAMKNALENSNFLQNVQSKYKAAIVDEFQDTDPIQWEIFQRLFSPSKTPWGYLYLVGDPKQSIYSFRQADIHTYLAAAKEMGEKNLATLDVNYRSQPSLIHALNVLFSEKSSPGWMSLRGLSYSEVDSPSHATQKIFSDNRESIHFYIAEEKEATGFPLEKIEREHFLPFMVQEIQRINKTDGIPLSHFAVLVADRFQAARTTDYLKAYNIPCISQRSGSLADSPALSAFIDLLKGVLHPRHESSLKTALGGKVIRWTHDRVRELDDPQKLEKVLYPFLKLKKVLIHQGITPFYQQLMQTCWHEDGQTVLERLLSQEGSSEFYHDFQQIAELLFEYEVQQRPTPEGLVSYLGQLKMLVFDEDPRMKKLLDPTKQAVNIMTLHASKGLEFDIVFTLGLVKRSRAPEQLLPLKTGNERYLGIISDKSQPEYQQYCQELDAEKMRQLYVAMTRARYRLYNPVAIIPRSKKMELGCASPMELFLGKLAQPAIDHRGLYSRIKGYDGTAFRQYLEGTSAITHTLLNETPAILISDEVKGDIFLQEPRNVKIPGSRKFIHSFSSLNTRTAVSLKQKNPPHDFQAEEKTPHTLPSGSETGNLLHKCLEKISFGNMQSAELEGVVSPFLMGTPFQDWEAVLAEMLHNTMTTSLTETFCLADVDPDKCFFEAEFLYSSRENIAPGYVKGFIDLMFEHQGKYYLLDWKTNWLGEACTDYHKEALKQAMEEHNYYFQAQLYQDALKRYLRLVDKRPFEEIFGGVFYLFLRGLDPQLGNQFGVLHL